MIPGVHFCQRANPKNFSAELRAHLFGPGLESTVYEQSTVYQQLRQSTVIRHVSHAQASSAMPMSQSQTQFSGVSQSQAPSASVSQSQCSGIMSQAQAPSASVSQSQFSGMSQPQAAAASMSQSQAPSAPQAQFAGMSRPQVAQPQAAMSQLAIMPQIQSRQFPVQTLPRHQPPKKFFQQGGPATNTSAAPAELDGAALRGQREPQVQPHQPPPSATSSQPVHAPPATCSPSPERSSAPDEEDPWVASRCRRFANRARRYLPDSNGARLGSGALWEFAGVLSMAHNFALRFDADDTPDNPRVFCLACRLYLHGEVETGEQLEEAGRLHSHLCSVPHRLNMELFDPSGELAIVWRERYCVAALQQLASGDLLREGHSPADTLDATDTSNFPAWLKTPEQNAADRSIEEQSVEQGGDTADDYGGEGAGGGDREKSSRNERTAGGGEQDRRKTTGDRRMDQTGADGDWAGGDWGESSSWSWDVSREGGNW